MGNDFEFQPKPIEKWKGRYARIPGDESVFHIKNIDGQKSLVLNWKTGEYEATCCACACHGVKNLINAVISAKRKMGGSGGGSFQINEFGQVIVPASNGSGQRLFVGEIKGSVLFENPLEDDCFWDISKVDGLNRGDQWTLPYVGIPYNLNKQSKIYFYHNYEEGGKSEYPSRQDIQLISSLREIRRYGGIRFIVNPFGIVLTKTPPEGKWAMDEKWTAVYVGRINYDSWFQKEK